MRALNRLLERTHAVGARDDTLYLIMGSSHQPERTLLQARTWCRVPWTDDTESAVRARLLAGTCSFMQFPGKPGARGGPFKDLVPLLTRAAPHVGTPAVVHQLERLV